jgi:anti-sigma regulatory factor (Ser/Thr protein kinase)
VNDRRRDDDPSGLVPGRSATEASFRYAFPATPSELAVLRAGLREWLQEARIDGELVEATILSVSEAAANAIEHGLRFDRSGTVTVVASIGEDGVVEVAVGDDGSWREPHVDGSRGYGLRIIDAVMDDVRVERRSPGTVVRMGLRPPADVPRRSPRRRGGWRRSSATATEA